MHRTGLDPQEQRLFFRGKEKDGKEHLHIEGVKDKSKILLLVDANSGEKKREEIRQEEIKNDEEISKASEAVAGVRAEVDKLSQRVSLCLQWKCFGNALAGASSKLF